MAKKKYPKNKDEFLAKVAKIQAKRGYFKPRAYAIGIIREKPVYCFLPMVLNIGKNEGTFAIIFNVLKLFGNGRLSSKFQLNPAQVREVLANLEWAKTSGHTVNITSLERALLLAECTEEGMCCVSVVMIWGGDDLGAYNVDRANRDLIHLISCTQGELESNSKFQKAIAEIPIKVGVQQPQTKRRS